MAALDRLRFLKRNGLRGGKLLDVGAGGGEFIYLSKRSGYQSVGVEPDIGYSEFARSQYGVDVRTGDVRKVNDTYHVITMFHVLEHLAKPTQAFKTLWALVDTGGYVFIEVPDIHAANASPHNTYFKAHVFYSVPLLSLLVQAHILSRSRLTRVQIYESCLKESLKSRP